MQVEIIAEGTLVALRTHCVTGAERSVELGWTIRKRHYDARTIERPKGCFVKDVRPSETWLYLEGGPTGYESIRLGDWEEKELLSGEKTGWSACAGTTGRWDKLFVPITEMRRVLTEVWGSAGEWL